MADKPIWHYSVYPHLLSMLRDGFIKPATAFVEPPERPIVWFSKSQTWERTVTKGLAIAGWKFCHARFPWDVVPWRASGSNRGVARGCALRLARPATIERNGVADGERPCSRRQRHGSRSSGLVSHLRAGADGSLGRHSSLRRRGLDHAKGTEGVPRCGQRFRSLGVTSGAEHRQENYSEQGTHATTSAIERSSTPYGR